MTKQQLQLVKQTWKLLREEDPVVLGDIFYGRLFFKYPALRLMFKGPMVIQYQKFIDMLSILIARLDRPDSIAQEIRTLARNHEAYGVQPAHYQDVKDALLWMLERGLGSDWNTEVRQAWIVCYDRLTHEMLKKDERP